MDETFERRVVALVKRRFYGQARLFPVGASPDFSLLRASLSGPAELVEVIRRTCTFPCATTFSTSEDLSSLQLCVAWRNLSTLPRQPAVSLVRVPSPSCTGSWDVYALFRSVGYPNEFTPREAEMCANYAWSLRTLVDHAQKAPLPQGACALQVREFAQECRKDPSSSLEVHVPTFLMERLWQEVGLLGADKVVLTPNAPAQCPGVQDTVRLKEVLTTNHLDYNYQSSARVFAPDDFTPEQQEIYRTLRVRDAMDVSSAQEATLLLA